LSILVCILKENVLGAPEYPTHCSLAVRFKLVYPSLPATAGFIRNLL
jgi:hypothetical protein